jgi:hypothetical protein
MCDQLMCDWTFVKPESFHYKDSKVCVPFLLLEILKVMLDTGVIFNSLSGVGSYISILPGNTKGGSITVLLTSCLTGLD